MLGRRPSSCGRATPVEIGGGDARVAARHDDPADAVAAVRGRAPAGAAAHRVRRPARTRLDVDEVCAALSATTDATLEAALQIALRAVAAERGLRRAADPVRGHRHGPPRRRRDRLRLRRRRHVRLRERSARRRTERASRPSPSDVAGRLRSLLGSPSSSDPPLALDADLRPEGRNGAARPLAGRPTRATTRAGRRRGRRRRCCGPARSPVTPSSARRFVALIDPVRYPAGGVAADDLHRDPPAQGPGRQRAAAARRRPDDAHQARPRRAGRHRVDGAAAAARPRRTRCPALRTTRTLDALDAAARGRPARRRAGRRAGDGLAAGDPGAQRDHARARQARATSCPHWARSWSRWRGRWATRSGSDPGQLVDDYRRAARRARRVVEDVFYGSTDARSAVAACGTARQRWVGHAEVRSVDGGA